MSDTSSGGVEVDPVVPSKLLDVGVLCEVLLGLVLDVVVEREHGLGRSVDLGQLERVEPGEGRVRVSLEVRMGLATVRDEATDLLMTGPVLSWVML